MVDVNSIKSYIGNNYTRFGVNKQREIIRLLYEITKREGCDFRDVLQGVAPDQRLFAPLKKYLLRRRYPSLATEIRGGHARFSRGRIPAVKMDPSLRMPLREGERGRIVPKRFLIEASVMETEIVARIQKIFPDVPRSVITTYQESVGKTRYTLEDFNRRLDDFFIVRERQNFFIPCPCSRKSARCGYHVMNLGFGCAFECAYCYLQAYTNAPGIRIPANLEDFFAQFERYQQDVRLGSGQFTDSLAFDHISGYAPRLIEFFRRHPRSTFEFKTKSDNVALILKTAPCPNVLVSWSLNPQPVIDAAEFYTASLQERLEAAQKCAGAGYRVAFHFDPIIHYSGWERDYERTVHMVFDYVEPRNIDCFSLGALRMPFRLKQAIENRFPDTRILDGELTPGYDGKWRYSRSLRQEIYSRMRQWIHSRCQDVSIYLCMEEPCLAAANPFQGCL